MPDYSNTYSNTVGSGGDFATIALWFASRKDQSHVDGDLEECCLLDGVHSFTTTQRTWDTNGDLTIRYKAQTPQDGKLDTGAILALDGTHEFKRDGNTTIEIIDCVCSGTDVFSPFQIAATTPGAARDNTINLTRTIWTKRTTHGYWIQIFQMDGTTTFNIENTVIENQLDGNMDWLLGGGNSNRSINLNVSGCTWHNVRVNLNQTDTSCTFVSVGNIYNTHPTAARLLFCPTLTDCSSIDDITERGTGNHANVFGTIINHSPLVTFNTDGSDPAVGEVSFLGDYTVCSQNFALVDHPNNLALDYVVSGPALGFTSTSEDLSNSTRLGTADCGAFERPRLKNKVTPVNLF